jgi:hypothetical protein
LPISPCSAKDGSPPSAAVPFDVTFAALSRIRVSTPDGSRLGPKGRLRDSSVSADEYRRETDRVSKRGGPVIMGYAISVIVVVSALAVAYRLARSQGVGWRRTAPCKWCGRPTIQTVHGYTIDGMLWKGRVCRCRGWQCNECHLLNQPAATCFQ